MVFWYNNIQKISKICKYEQPDYLNLTSANEKFTDNIYTLTRKKSKGIVDYLVLTKRQPV
jgi:hypothetical protein